MKNPKVSVIIVNWNGMDYLKNCLDSVFGIDYKNYNVIFIDNASNDDSVDFVKRRYKNNIKSGKLKMIVNEKNYGFAKGNNIGYSLTNAPYVYLLNNDTILSKDCLSSLVNSGIKNHAQIIGSYDFPFNTKDLDKIEINYTKTLNLVGSNANIPSKSKETIFVSAVSCLVDRQVAKKLFDEDYFMYCEDVYLCWLALLNGNKVIYEPGARLQHYGSGASEKIKSSSLYYRERNRLLNLFIFYEKKTLVKIFPFLMADCLFRTLAYLSNLTLFKEWMKSNWWLLYNIKKIKLKRKKIQSIRKIKDEKILKLMTYRLFPNKRGGCRLFWRVVDLLTHQYCKLTNLKTMEFYK